MPREERPQPLSPRRESGRRRLALGRSPRLDLDGGSSDDGGEAGRDASSAGQCAAEPAEGARAYRAPNGWGGGGVTNLRAVCGRSSFLILVA